MRDGFTGRKTLRSLPELLGLNRAIHPTVEDLDDDRSRLQALGPYRPYGVGGYARSRIHFNRQPGYFGRDDILKYITTPGTLIQEQREQLGLSQRALARRAGITQAAVSRIERGQVAPNWETVRALLLAMGCEPDLQARRLDGRWDPVHLAASRRRSPAERLELAISANRLAGRLRQAATEGRRGS